MKLACYLPDGLSLDIRPASNRRGWMDETDERFAAVPCAVDGRVAHVEEQHEHAVVRTGHELA